MCLEYCSTGNMYALHGELVELSRTHCMVSLKDTLHGELPPSLLLPQQQELEAPKTPNNRMVTDSVFLAG